MSSEKKVFLYHAEEDTKFAVEFQEHLRPLVDEGYISLFARADIKAGDTILKELTQEIKKAEIVLLCVTNDLLIDPLFATDIKSLIVSQRNKGKCLVVPVLFKPCLWHITLLANLNPAPSSKTPIDIFEKKELGFQTVGMELLTLFDCFDTAIHSQGVEADKLSAGLPAFNYSHQLPPDSAAPILPAAEGPLNVLVLKGRGRSGHELLAWRWRSAAFPKSPEPQFCTLDISATPDNATQIGQEIWRTLNEGAMYVGEESKLEAQLASLLLQLLAQKPIVIRLDGFNPSIHTEVINLFFNTLQKAMAEEIGKKPGQPPLQSLWFYLFYRFEEDEVAFSLDFPTQVVLPSVSPVSKEDFENWEKKTFSGKSIKDIFLYNKKVADSILDPDEKKNEVMDVLDRICQAVYAKEDLYDQYIATLK